MAIAAVPTDVLEAFVQEWRRCALLAYPAHAAHAYREQGDPFRHPVGHLLATSLRHLAEELFGDFDPARVAQALEPLVRLQAVQGTSADDATRFVALAGRAAHSLGAPLHSPWLAVLDARLATLGVMTTECLDRCRQDIAAIGARAARRRTYVPDRLHAQAALAEANRRPDRAAPAPLSARASARTTGPRDDAP